MNDAGKGSMVSSDAIDLEKFRLRSFVDGLIEDGRVEIHGEYVALADVGHVIEDSDRTVLFRQAGPEKVELVARVSSSRELVAAAFGVPMDDLVEEYRRRLNTPQPVVDVESGEAPVHQVITTGDDVDLTKLPFFPQHHLDGGLYISSAIDHAIDPETGLTNIGCRRLSLRNRYEMAANLTGNSDLRRIYRAAVARGETLAVNFAIGSHPLDLAAATAPSSGDEVLLLATMRGEPAPLVKAVTNDVRVPADAELVIEGYFDEGGYREPEGPYGEGIGYYSPINMDPVYHVTAITHRTDVLHQSVLHGSAEFLRHSDSSNLGTIRNEGAILQALMKAGIDIVKVHLVVGSGRSQHLRISINQTHPGQARAAMVALFAARASLKHIWVFDADVDVFNDRHVEWAMASRFRVDTDLMILEGMPGTFMDPSVDETGAPCRSGAKSRPRIPVPARRVSANRRVIRPCAKPSKPGHCISSISWRRWAAGKGSMSPWRSTNCGNRESWSAMPRVTSPSARRKREPPASSAEAGI